MATKCSPTPNKKQYFISIDVQCAAIGRGHFDLHPCSVAALGISDLNQAPRDKHFTFKQVVYVPNIKSPLTAMTGLTFDAIEQKGVPLNHVIEAFQKQLFELKNTNHYEVIIVGQAPYFALARLRLQKNVHFDEIVDLAHWFRPDIGHVYSLKEQAFGLLNQDLRNINKANDIFVKCVVELELYRKYVRADDHVIDECKKTLNTIHKDESLFFLIKKRYRMCRGIWDHSKCHCGQPSIAQKDLTVEIISNAMQKARICHQLDDFDPERHARRGRGRGMGRGRGRGSGRGGYRGRGGNRGRGRGGFRGRDRGRGGRGRGRGGFRGRDRGRGGRGRGRGGFRGRDRGRGGRGRGSSFRGRGGASIRPMGNRFNDNGYNQMNNLNVQMNSLQVH
eukprot:923740_1